MSGKIVKLTSENVKRIQVVEISPSGNLIVIGGRNEQGKSSVLDSIEYALGGEPDVKMPIRKGEDRARVVVDLGDIKITRKFTHSGSSLVVENSDGVKQSSPQSILDKMVGRLTFDPLEFSRQKPEEQGKTLRALVGLDFTKSDSERADLFKQRTDVNRDIKALSSRIAAMPVYNDAPTAEVSATDIIKQQSAAMEENAAFDRAHSNVSNLEQELMRKNAEIQSLQTQIANMADRLNAQKKSAASTEEDLEAARLAAAMASQVDMSQFASALQNIEKTNGMVRANKARASVVAEMKEKQSASESLTSKIEDIDAEKRKQITSAKYPIGGLDFDASGGVTLNGIPLSQCSGAQQLKVSVAIGLALNPTLRILLIRDGSLLDADNLEVVAKMAQEADAQVWIERVGTDAATSVVIEDGKLLES